MYFNINVNSKISIFKCQIVDYLEKNKYVRQYIKKHSIYTAGCLLPMLVESREISLYRSKIKLKDILRVLFFPSL